MAGSEILIAVIGVTGAGKTSFISRATGRSDLKIGHGIDSCTENVVAITYTPDRQKVTLIDTPGFDDSEKSDTDVLELVAAYMAKSYENGTLLTGILFLQLVSQVQLQGSEKKRTRLFKTIMGENAYQRVVIATTMWNQLSEAEATVRQNQRKIRADVWGDMVSRGTRVVRHGDNVESATGIVQLLAQFKTPVTLQIQKELLVSGGRVARTSEGRQLDEDLGTEVAKLREEIEALRIAREDIFNENRDLRDKIARLEQDRDKLQRSNALQGFKVDV